jgi:hypothetical protein
LEIDVTGREYGADGCAGPEYEVDDNRLVGLQQAPDAHLFAILVDQGYIRQRISFNRTLISLVSGGSHACRTGQYDKDDQYEL